METLEGHLRTSQDCVQTLFWSTAAATASVKRSPSWYRQQWRTIVSQVLFSPKCILVVVTDTSYQTVAHESPTADQILSTVVVIVLTQ